MRLVVVKVGGSLFDWPELGRRLRDWLAELSESTVLLVPGGGAAADAVRELDRCHELGDEAAHWLALQAMTVNAYFLVELVPGARVASHAHFCEVRLNEGAVFVLDAHAFARDDEGRPGQLPHTWKTTSDSVAARVAVVAGAEELVLLKSVNVPAGLTWDEAVRRGLVDPLFPEVLRQAGPDLRTRMVNLRGVK